MRRPALKAHRQQLHFDIKVSKLLKKQQQKTHTHKQQNIQWDIIFITKSYLNGSSLQNLFKQQRNSI